MSESLAVLVETLAIIQPRRVECAHAPTAIGWEILNRITQRFEREIRQQLGREGN